MLIIFNYFVFTLTSYQRHKWTNQLKEDTAEAQQLPPIVNFTKWLWYFLYCHFYLQCTVQTTPTLWHSAHSATAQTTANKFIEIKIFIYCSIHHGPKINGPFLLHPRAVSTARRKHRAARYSPHTEDTGPYCKIFLKFLYTPEPTDKSRNNTIFSSLR